MIRLEHFLNAPGYCSANRTADCRSTVPDHLSRTVGLLSESPRTAGLNDPGGNRGYAEITDDTDYHKDAVHFTGRIRYECGVLHPLDVLLQHQDLYA